MGARQEQQGCDVARCEEVLMPRAQQRRAVSAVTLGWCVGPALARRNAAGWTRRVDKRSHAIVSFVSCSPRRARLARARDSAEGALAADTRRLSLCWLRLRGGSDDTACSQHAPQRAAPSGADGQNCLELATDTSLGKASARTMSRRSVLIGAAGVMASMLGMSVVQPVREAQAVSLAPTPINAYSRRRRLREKRKKRAAEANNPVVNALESMKMRTKKKGVKAEEEHLPALASGVVAMGASAIATLIIHPVDTIKTRLQVEPSHVLEAAPPVAPVQVAHGAAGHHGASPGANAGEGTASANVAESVQEIVDEQVELARRRRKALFSGLYVGLLSNILKEAPNCAIYIGCYEYFKDVLLSMQSPFFTAYPILAYMIAGGLGDFLGSIVRVPAELANKRLQLGLSSSLKQALTEMFSSDTNREAVWHSWRAIIYRDVPYGAIQIALYEQLKGFITQRMNVDPMGVALQLNDATSLWQDCMVGAVAGCVAALITTPPDVVVTRLSSQYPQSYLEDKKYMNAVTTARRIWRDEGWTGFFRGGLQRGAYYAPLIGLFFALYEAGRHTYLHPPELVLTVIDELSLYIF
ncbi:S-adenosylmethionine carrier 1, chloroplastic/mitochondrial [Porphyridium purpureum]|uniref:S-adenosylmethionine carrier 1, chloroplastic/mitochondrial n=1 Tax=Porphyridium purpureum TaxID=35688 RepID=A0A5J4YWR4_PORPP|nr:S-adenosylmethionine carrier 1, chloroplastic/mitochondrial [Porphyridium purpureum]|eukprot:POR7297..scf227_4